ncbi:MAG: acetyl-CoA carboxylase [Actinophytocola sp.]|uniref:carboxyl transferase domain-containing protein n=1 Tax=Actinophytocola sp. TaxID=1872138 RepID=UPI001323DB4E|nr:carboxyl transferase domain-containing protein [Actinophytocola sp.]MPZ80241.1 acetyl-CoA carboxylase [Actinophytocola sp.]
MVDGARQVIARLVDDFVEFDVVGPAYGPDGPLDWAGYGVSRKAAAARSGTAESVVCGRGTLDGMPVVLVAFDFRFLGGSVGTGTGARISSAFTRARVSGLPVVSLIATGGTRMQEGVLSLRQLQLVTREAVRLPTPHLAVLRDPTTGGVWASLGAGADVVLAERGAQVGFAGRRVRPAATADDPAYTAESQFAAGNVDEVVDDPAGPLAEWLRLLTDPSGEPAEVPRALGAPTPAASGRQAVERARSAARPRAGAYLDDYFESRREIRGDRAGGVDDGMSCGVGRRGGRSIAFAAQTGTATTPAGYRTAARLVRLADRLGLPVLTLVDTPGAAADPAAELAGAGPAIAGLFATIAAARVPVTTLVVGEGGSGGALALCSPDRLWIAPDAYFSVIAPELAAAILKRDPAEIPALADQLKLRPRDLLELGVVQGIAARQ